jgi:glutamine cyclotransferase
MLFVDPHNTFRKLNRYIFLFRLPTALMLLVAAATCSRRSEAPAQQADIPVVKPSVVRIIHHDSASFTQGLVFSGGRLYESTGLYGSSSLRRIDPVDGRLEKSIKLDSRFFGEGLALMDGRLVQLTWQEGKALIYSSGDFDEVDAFGYAGEGWGLAAGGTSFFMSNGSDTLYVRNRTFKIERKITVRINGKPLVRLNELEYARKSIYANVWYSNFIFEIDPGTGNVSRIIDCTDLAVQAGALEGENVLNGIAFDESTQRFFLTGKKWPMIFEVEIPAGAPVQTSGGAR